MIIYLVKSEYRGDEYIDYVNEKAFFKKEDAIKYARQLDEERSMSLDFITDAFIKAYDECVQEVIKSDETFTPKEYVEIMTKKMQEKGFNINTQQCNQYQDWEDGMDYVDWQVEEIELCE